MLAFDFSLPLIYSAERSSDPASLPLRGQKSTIFEAFSVMTSRVLGTAFSIMFVFLNW